jgi:hypothetical protein
MMTEQSSLFTGEGLLSLGTLSQQFENWKMR